MRWLDGITDTMHMNLGKTLGDGREREAWHAAMCGSKRVKNDWAAEQQEQLCLIH